MDKKQKQIIGVIVAAIGLIVYAWTEYKKNQPEPAPPSDQSGYLFCFWNLENFFDDNLEGKYRGVDKEFDEWFSSDSQALKLKIDHLCDILLKMNSGKGPDVLALCEVETTDRAPEMLKEALNKRISDPKLHYKHIVMKPVKKGRYISCVVMTRLPLSKKSHPKPDFAAHHRITEAHLSVNGHDLSVVAAHWTSRATEDAGTPNGKRYEYADRIYKRFREFHKDNPSADFLVAGDFNDTPVDQSVRAGLRSTSDLSKPAGGGSPKFYNLFEKFHEMGKGTLSYRKKPFLFDQILISPGLLFDKSGWSVNPETAQIWTEGMSRRNAPFRFGDPPPDWKGARGYSDHFPVLVRVKVTDK